MNVRTHLAFPVDGTIIILSIIGESLAEGSNEFILLLDVLSWLSAYMGCGNGSRVAHLCTFSKPFDVLLGHMYEIPEQLNARFLGGVSHVGIIQGRKLGQESPHLTCGLIIVDLEVGQFLVENAAQLIPLAAYLPRQVLTCVDLGLEIVSLPYDGIILAAGFGQF